VLVSIDGTPSFEVIATITDNILTDPPGQTGTLHIAEAERDNDHLRRPSTAQGCVKRLLRPASPLREATHAWNAIGVCYSNKGGRKMKTVILTLSAAVLIAAAPGVLARHDPHQHHQALKKRPQVVYGYAPWRGYGYAPSAPKDNAYNDDASRNAGGGAGGGGGGGGGGAGGGGSGM
jgi:uncharacterized membrane protein YgcG